MNSFFSALLAAFQPSRRGNTIKAITLFCNDAWITKKIQRFPLYSSFRKKNWGLRLSGWKNWFLWSLFGDFRADGTLKLCPSFYLCNILWYQKTIEPPPVPFHQHSPLHTLKVTHISVKLNCMQCKQSDFVRWKKNTDFKSFMVWVKWMFDQVFEPSSAQSISNTGVFSVTPAQRMNPVD